MMKTIDEIENKFNTQTVDSEQTLMIQLKNELFQKLAIGLDLILPNGREKSLVFTKLEEASMWATKSITHIKQIKE